MIKQTFEFNSFGPWVFEIADMHKFPPLFSNYEYLLDEACLFLKFPRNIERRNATPDMNLYDVVLGIFNDYILVLRCTNNKVLETSISINDINYLIKKEFLLTGVLILKTPKTTVTVNYNTVSSAIIDHLIRLIRKLQQRLPIALHLSSVIYKESPENILFVNAIKYLNKHEPENKLIAYQPRFKLTQKLSLFSKLINTTYIPTPSATYLFMVNDSELIILDHSSKNEDDKASRYAYSYIYIPLAQIRKSIITPDIQYSNTDILSIALPASTLYFPVNTDNKGIRSLARTLRQH